jgi:superfamily II DNA helicase RecQ
MRDRLIISVSPNRKNLRFCVINGQNDLIFSKFGWLINNIKEKSMNDIACVVNYLILKLGNHAYHPPESRKARDCLIGIYHSSSWSHSKELVIQSLKGNGKVRVVVTSSALSMGVNFPYVRYVINWGPARNLLDPLQEAGRAGRDGLQSHVVIVYHGQQLRSCENELKDFVKSTDCLRVAAYKPFDGNIEQLQPGHLCCSICTNTCKCGGDMVGCKYVPI